MCWARLVYYSLWQPWGATVDTNTVEASIRNAQGSNANKLILLSRNKWRKTVLMPSTEARSWPAKLLRISGLLSLILLAGCCSPSVSSYRLPEPAADLMMPEKTGSEYSEQAGQNIKQWQTKLEDSLTK